MTSIYRYALYVLFNLGAYTWRVRTRWRAAAGGQETTLEKAFRNAAQSHDAALIALYAPFMAS